MSFLTTTDAVLSYCFAFIGAVAINLFPYVNQGDLTKSVLTSTLKQIEFRRALYFNVALGLILDFGYVLVEKRGLNVFLSLQIGASAPAIFLNIVGAIKKSKSRSVRRSSREASE